MDADEKKTLLKQDQRKIVTLSGEVHNRINQEINRFLGEHPERAWKRNAMYYSMVRFYDEHGVVPEIVIDTQEEVH